MNQYIQDILSQPAALRDALNNYSTSALEKIKLSDFDRIIISGMGSSYNAAYPAFIELSKHPVPVQLVNAAELLHSFMGTITPRTLLWLNSQSGRSAEPVRLLEKLSQPPACLLTCVNDVASPMAERANICIPIHAGKEDIVSTKTYTNMMAINLLTAVQLAGEDPGAVISEMRAAADAMESWLADWEARVRELNSMLGDFNELFLIGRGASMSTVWNGPLNNKEAAKFSFEGMHAADFRHGPLEIVSKGFVAMILAGADQTSALNCELAREIISYGGRVIWLDSSPDAELSTLLLPKTSELSCPLVEILPLQLLTLVMSNRKGLQAGQFRYLKKVTLRE
ncbi:MAG: SIS domain-containing protein [Chloroflexi bacterium]|nr:SIS domain-containing protein [Chloroflexota bacterium]